MKYNGVITLKINTQKLVRVIAPLLSVLCIIVMCIMPVDAANIDYNDLISNIVVDGDNDLVTITVPSGYLLTQIVDGGTGAALVTNTGGAASYPVVSGYPYTVIFYAFQNGTDHLLLENIPNFTFVDYNFSISSPSGLGYETPSVFSDWYYFDADSQYLSMSRTEHGNQVLTGDHSYTQFISKVPGTVSGSCNFTFYHLKPLSSGELTVRLNSLTLTFTISSLYRLQQETGKTNEILKVVEQQLAEQGQKLDDIINGTSDQQNSADQFKDDVNGSVEDLDQFGNVMNNIPYPTIDTDSLVPEDIFYGSSYLTYISTIQEFWKSNTLSTVTLVLGSLLLISYVLFGEKG